MKRNTSTSTTSFVLATFVVGLLAICVGLGAAVLVNAAVLYIGNVILHAAFTVPMLSFGQDLAVAFVLSIGFAGLRSLLGKS